MQVLDVLLIEDDPGGVLLAQEAFAQPAISSQLHVTADGEQAASTSPSAGCRIEAWRGSPRCLGAALGK